MAAEEAACNGGGEARKAEFAVKEAAAASPEPNVVEKREGEVVSGPLVVANSNSGGLSGVEDASESNAPPAVAVAGGHEADAARNASLVNVHVHAVAEAPVCVEEGSGERAAADVAELVEQEVDVGEPDGMGVAMANGHDHVDTSIADSEVPVGDDSIKQATADVTEHEVISRDQDGMDVSKANEHCESGAAAAKSGIRVDYSNGEQTTAIAVKLVEQEVAAEEQDARDCLLTNGNAGLCEAAEVFDVQGKEGKGEGNAKLVEQGNTDVSMVHGHDQFDRSVDSCTVDVECEVCGDKDKGRESADATYLVGQATASGEAANESMANGCDHPNTNADFGGAPTQTEVCPKEREVAQSAADGVEIVETKRALKIEGQGSEGDAKVANSEVPREDEVHTNGHGHAEESADVVAELEPLVEEGQGEATLVIDHLEDRADSDREETVQYTGASGADEIAEEVESQVEQRKDKAVCDVTELTDGFAKRNEEALLGGELAKHEADVSSLQPAEPSSYSTVEVEKEETMEPVRLEEATLASIQQQTADSFQDTEGQKQSETPGNHIAGRNDNDKLDAELKQEPDMEVVDGVQLQADPAVVATAFHIEPRSSDLVDSEGVRVEHSTPACELETPDDAPREDNGSQENFSYAIAQVELGAFKEHETVGVDEAEPSYRTRNECGVIAKAEASSNKEDKPNGIGKDGESAGPTRDPHSENMVDASSPDDQLNLCNISTPCDVVSSGIGNMDSFPINEPAPSAENPLEDTPSPHDDTCTLDGACNEVSSENADAFTKSSFQVETKYVKDLESPPVDVIICDEHKDDGEKVLGDNNDSSELQLEIDTKNKGDVQVIIPQRIYITKVPRFAGEDLWAKIQVAQVHLDQLTQKRDAINVQRQKQKALCDEYREKLEAARQAQRGARAAHGDKRHDLNSVQSMIGKLNKANSIQEIDETIAMKDKIIVHESISLKEEKLLLQEIKELKAQKKQLCSNMGSKAEMNEAFHQKEHIHEQHKTLKKDSGELLTNLKSLEEKTRVVHKAYDDERVALRKLNEEHRAANEIRQKAYDEWFALKMEPSKKNKYFFMYRNDQKTTSYYLSMGDMVGLQLYCNNQVERFMEVWNKDEDFRRQYVESNKISTLRRLGTSDGRRIGPDEVPPEIPGRSNRKPSNPSLLPVSSPHVSFSASEATPAKSTSVITPVEEDSFPVLQDPPNSKHSKSKFPGSSSGKERTGALVPERQDVERLEREKMCRMEEDLELARQAAELAAREEELRQEKAAAEKERLRLEQKAKAKEAEERKKRKAEKAQERADYRAWKEAEIIEKKKAKKDKKNGATSVDSANGSGEGNAEAIATNYTAASTTANTREAGVSQHTAPKKRPSRPSIALKQLNRVEPMPLPLRNRGKRKMRQYMMVTVAVLMSVLALFVAGNYVLNLARLA